MRIDESHNTRIIATPHISAKPHVGHLWIAWLNREVARSAGGSFLAMFEFGQSRRNWPYFGEEKMADYADLMLEAMEWFGVAPDLVVDEAMVAEAVEGYKCRFPEILSVKGVPAHTRLMHTGDAGWAESFFSDVEATFERVIFDRLYRCSPVIRGEDLAVENFLYSYVATALGFEPPTQVYVPRLRWHDDTMISQTAGNAGVDALMKSISPEGLRERLREGCLKDPQGAVCLDNLRSDPRLRID